MTKGVIGKVLTEDEAPQPEFTKEIDFIISPISIFSRKNLALIKELYIGKIMYHLNLKIKNMCEDQKVSTDKIIKLIRDIYLLLGNNKINEIIKNILDNTPPNSLRKKLKTGEIKLFFIIPPFTHVEFENIKSAAALLKIPLDEKVYLPSQKCWTKDVVPVGISYIQAMEQTAEIYSNVRSTGKYQSLTGQASKGKSLEGGQGLG